MYMHCPPHHLLEMAIDSIVQLEALILIDLVIQSLTVDGLENLEGVIVLVLIYLVIQNIMVDGLENQEGMRVEGNALNLRDDCSVLYPIRNHSML